MSETVVKALTGIGACIASGAAGMSFTASAAFNNQNYLMLGAVFALQAGCALVVSVGYKEDKKVDALEGQDKSNAAAKDVGSKMISSGPLPSSP